MTIKIHKATHKIINKNGISLWLPSNIVGGRFNLNDPDVYAESSNQLYPLGTKLEYADGRVFRYGKWGATSTNVPLARMVVNANACPGATGEEDVDGYEGDPYIAAAVGAEQVDLEIATAYAENFFEDGMLAVYPTVAFREYRILGSELGNGTYCRVYIDEPLKEALTVTTGVTAYKSIYSQLKDAAAEGATFVSAVGAVQTQTFTSAYFGWVQTWGRCIITPTAYFGDTANERMAQLHTDGTIALKSADGTHTVGYLTQRTVSGYGDLEIMLQLGR